jgi:SAM-dependent methyltransferase
MICRICHTHSNDKIVLKEKMFGINETYMYFICPNCYCIQIKDIPVDLSKYYPKNYYSFTEVEKPKLKKEIKNLIYKLISFVKKDFHIQPSFSVYDIFYKDKAKRILDIGCGNGNLLKEMRSYGFTHLTGSDPFIEKEIHEKGLEIKKKTLDQMNGVYDIIMSHHSLEHMSDPSNFFKNITRLITPTGKLVLRIPIYPNYIWEKYRTDWIQLDAPRHLYTFSLKSIDVLCRNNGLRIDNAKFDGHAWSLASTEFCLSGNTHEEFTKNIEITTEHYRLNEAANSSKNGDTVCLTIVKEKN